MPTAFERAFAIIVGEEGGMSTVRSDPGNWTCGAVGVGELRGTKYGIAASAHPGLDIANITLDQARAIYRKQYWDLIRGDDLPPTFALIVFDAAVNNGVGRAIRWLQAAVGVAQDGEVGKVTLAAVQAHHGHGADVQAEFMAERMLFMAGLPGWRSDGRGWSRRLAKLPYLTGAMLDV